MLGGGLLIAVESGPKGQCVHHRIVGKAHFYCFDWLDSLTPTAQSIFARHSFLQILLRFICDLTVRAL